MTTANKACYFITKFAQKAVMNRKLSAFSLKSFSFRYGTAMLFVGAALVVTLLIWMLVKPLASPLFLVAIMATAWRAGLRPGVFATLLSGMLVDFFFIAPEYQLSGSSDDVLRLAVFMLEGFALCRLVTWRTDAAEKIETSRAELQALSLRQQSLLETERKRIALEIHDELGQTLTGLKMEIHSVNRQIKESLHPSANTLGEQMKDLLELTDDAVQTVRRIATELRPPILDDLGLAAAIEWQTQEFGRRTGISCVVATDVEGVDFASDFATAVFRIFQETLTNVVRHAEAETITVNLKKSDQKLTLRVEDDGKGIQNSETHGSVSLGILGMRERARLIGGELEIFNGDENGTVILLSAPL
jgi:signal transduction histidine kinase